MSFKHIAGLSRPAIILLTLVLSGLLVSPGFAQEERRIVTLGDDLTRAQEGEVLELLGASRQDRIIRVTSEETTRGSRGIIEIPPGTPAISSTAITCQPEGSGLRVRITNIEEVTAGMYAQSLLTAGITDANVRVAAPSDAKAEGLTALTGIFKAYRLSPCVGGELDPERERLAQRELAVTVELGDSLGDREQASEVVLNTQEQVVSRKLRDRNEIEQVATNQLDKAGGNRVTGAPRNRLVDLMTDLGSPDIDYGGYSQGWTLERVNRNEVRISARPAGQETPTAGGDRANEGDTVRGTVTKIATGALTVGTAAGGQETIRATDNVPAVRNGQSAELGEIQATDRVTVERDANGRATRIVATSAGAGAAGQVVTGRVTTRNNNAFNVLTSGGDARDISTANTRNLEVTRNGRNATVDDIQPGDTVTVTLGADNRPRRIVAQSAPADDGGGFNPLWLWGLFFLPLALLARGEGGGTVVRQATTRGTSGSTPAGQVGTTRRADSFQVRPRRPNSSDPDNQRGGDIP